MPIRFLKVTAGLLEVAEWQPNCWISVVNPTLDEIQELEDRFGVPSGMINDISDNDERPRTEVDDGWQLIILRIPGETSDRLLPYMTVPFGVITRGDIFLTLCFSDTPMLEDFIQHKQRKRIVIASLYELLLRLFVSSSVWYSKYLKQINQRIRESERQLARTVLNTELQILNGLSKSLVFFITSLKGNSLLLSKVKTSRLSRAAPNPEEIAELLEDAEIEVMQAQEMARIYSDIIGGMLHAYESVIANNLNAVMKRLTAVSVVLMIPTLIASIYGMNVPNFFETFRFSFFAIIGASFGISLLIVVLFKQRDWL